MAKKLEATRLNLSIHGNDRSSGKNSGLRYGSGAVEQELSNSPRAVRRRAKNKTKK